MRSLAPLLHLAKRFTSENGLLGKYPGSHSLVPPQSNYDAYAPKRGEVSLLGDCLMPWTDTSPMHAAIKVLTVQGYDVRVIQPEQCCGGWFAHIGQDKKAATNVSALLKQTTNEPILALSTACHAFLSESQATSVEDLYTFLNRQWRPIANFTSRQQMVGVHTPCTRKMPINVNKPYIDLLARMPGLTIIPILQSSSCCGAGGQAQLTDPEQSKRIGIEAFSKEDIKDLNCIVTTNLSCQRQIQGLLGTKPIHQAIELIAEFDYKTSKLRLDGDFAIDSWAQFDLLCAYTMFIAARFAVLLC